MVWNFIGKKIRKQLDTAGIKTGENQLRNLKVKQTICRLSLLPDLLKMRFRIRQ